MGISLKNSRKVPSSILWSSSWLNYLAQFSALDASVSQKIYLSIYFISFVFYSEVSERATTLAAAKIMMRVVIRYCPSTTMSRPSSSKTQILPILWPGLWRSCQRPFQSTSFQAYLLWKVGTLKRLPFKSTLAVLFPTFLPEQSTLAFLRYYIGTYCTFFVHALIMTS